ncbi:dynein axonemal intermediate chain 7 isoform X4 [Gasterosteus aculeatus]
MSKGRKLTTTQRAKRQQDEDEKRLREEEEVRLQAEKEEHIRLERERKQKELERLESKDRERRGHELDQLRRLLENNQTAAIKWKTDAVEKAEWERYMNCGALPDPTVLQDVNRYISSWRDDPEVDITLVLKQCNLALQLLEEVELVLRDITDPRRGQYYQESLLELLELIHAKHLLTNEEILKEASENVDTETGNMQTVVKDENITLCLWANLRKSPRFKGFNFEEAGLDFKLPKQLAVRDIAVRILHTRYDHLSLLARMAHPRMHTPGHRYLSGGAIMNNALKSAASVQSRESSAEPAEGRSSQIQTQMEALNAEGELTSPLPLTTIDCGERVQVVDLMQYTPLGGVFHYNLFHLPPQVHKVNGWEIRQLLDHGLQNFPYPMEMSNLDENKALASPPVGVSVTLPDWVVFLETPEVARWDAAADQWRMDGITDVSYEEAEDKISFNMDAFHAFVLMQDTYANLPFQSWELRPLGQDSALFTINGALIDLSITIQGNQCMLQSEQTKGLSHVRGKWMSSPVLQKAMLNAGVNITVNEFTDKYVSTCGKDPLTEHAAYEQMALFASACAFAWSKWNAKCGAEHLVMQVLQPKYIESVNHVAFYSLPTLISLLGQACEHHSAAPVPEGSWSLYQLGAQRSQKLEVTEKSDGYSPDLYPGSEFHSTFIHMLQDDMSIEGIARTRESDYLFVDTVQSLLCATRPLM